MATPSLMISVEPFLSGSILFGPLAAGATGGDQAAQLSLRLRIKNNESSPMVVNTVALSFVPPPLVDPVAIPVNISVGANQTASWNFDTADNRILPVPAPPILNLSAWGPPIGRQARRGEERAQS